MIKVADIAFGRLQSPDLDLAEEFLLDFGMVRADRTADTLYMRGTDGDPWIHVTHLGPSRFIGLGFKARSEEDLETLARMDGASEIEDLDGPGGGRRVCIKDPHGYQIEVVCGREAAEEIQVRRFGINTAMDNLARAGELTRIGAGPSHVKRLGHAVIMTTDLDRGTRWYRDTLGLIRSDDVYVEGDTEKVIASFSRVDGGADYVDHHTFLCVAGPKVGLNHLAFEVQDIDDVFMGHAHLRERDRYEHMWGLGRHVLGSQVFDYWCDPWGRVHEHWTDSDRLNQENPGNMVPVEEGFQSQWGDPVPERFIGHAIP